MARRGPRFRRREAVSAGGVVYRSGPGGPEILLLETPGGVWGLPKGTPDPGETLEQTALREVREETGLEVALEERVGTVAYQFVRPEAGERSDKQVHYWLMRPVGGHLTDHDHEHVRVDWFPLDAALQRVTFENTATILRAAATLLRARDAAGCAARAGEAPPGGEGNAS